MSSSYERMPESIRKAYSQLKTQKRQKYGTYHKGVFHVHTPASYDYRYFQDIIEKEPKFIRVEITNAALQKLFDLCSQEDPIFANGFCSLEEFRPELSLDERFELLAYVRIALALRRLNLEYIVVADHNVLGGYDKLADAIEYLYSGAKINRPYVVGGIEISCADHNHVVVMFDKDDKTATEQMSLWLKEYVMSPEAGSYRTSLEVLREFNNDHFVSYIAHINTGKMFEHFTPTYKEKIFRLNDTCLVGVNDLSKCNRVENNISEFSNGRKVQFLLDNDAHSVIELSIAHTYIQANKLSFSAIREAIRDYDTCVKFEESTRPSCYIEGIIVYPGSEGFLSPKDSSKEDCFIALFSPAMNCLIGGRGTGKSTIISSINLLMNGVFETSESIESVCRHDEILIVASVNNKNYIFDYCKPTEGYHFVTLYRLAKQGGYRLVRGDFHPQNDVLEYIFRDLVDVYEVSSESRQYTWRKLTQATKTNLAKKLFHRAYVISNIMNQLSNSNISEFVMDTICQNEAIRKICEPIAVPRNRSIRTALMNSQRKASSRQMEVQKFLNTFNKEVKSLRIVSVPPTNEQAYIDILFPNLQEKPKVNQHSYNITQEDFATYILELIHTNGIVQIIEAIVNKDYKTLIGRLPLIKYAHSRNLKEVESDTKEITFASQIEVLRELCQRWHHDQSSSLFDCLEEYLSQSLRFDLEFDLKASNDPEQGLSQFRSISTLSLGQKVVAILTFILAYGKQNQDCTPLVIDQPEDNLDSQYIYSTLVEILKHTKDQRQVIIATHNSTLVTNTKTEQVIVLESDNGHGWIECDGYPTQKQIIKKILQYLEGGRLSFSHRTRVYKTVLQKE